jgi:hypothetical protein
MANTLWNEQDRKALDARLARLKPDARGQWGNLDAPLSGGQWGRLLYRHTDHHLTQFGV